MDIEKALQLKVGDVVAFPPDRGNPGGFSKIRWIGPKTIYESIGGKKYIWVTLHVGGVWPTNRLG